MIRGMRFPVALVLRMLASGMTTEEILFCVLIHCSRRRAFVQSSATQRDWWRSNGRPRRRRSGYPRAPQKTLIAEWTLSVNSTRESSSRLDSQVVTDTRVFFDGKPRPLLVEFVQGKGSKGRDAWVNRSWRGLLRSTVGVTSCPNSRLSRSRKSRGRKRICA